MIPKTLVFIISSAVLVGLLLASCGSEVTPPVQTPTPAPTISPETWTLINPEGIYDVEPAEIAATRLDTLDGKTIALRWNGKPDGDAFLNGVEERLAEEVPTAKVIKVYELDPQTATYASTVEAAAQAARSMAETYHPDIVIAAYAD